MVQPLMRGLALAAALGVAALAPLRPAAAQSLVRDAEIERTLDLLMAPILRGAGTPAGSVDLFLVADRRLNAFVAGGRNIILFTGLLTRLETPEQIQAVLAHELGHINGGHLARRGIEAQNATGAVAVGILLAIAAGVAGSPEAAAAVITGSTAALQRSFLAFSRSEEASADQAALTYMEAAGINPAGMLEVLEIFRGQEALAAGRIDPYAQTHPLSQDRIELAERRVNASPYRNRASEPELAYRVARMRAKFDGFLGRPERILATVPATDPSEPALIRRAVALHRTGDVRGALAAVAALVAARPRDPYYHELRGQILLESGRAAEAVPAYREAVRLAPDEPLIRAALARALLAPDDPALTGEALKLLERATRDDPRNAGALRDLAVAYARTGREGEAALATAERYALETRFRDALIHARRAQTLLPVGSPGWLKAQDIILIGERIAQKG